jgi:hypothetical protein
VGATAANSSAGGASVAAGKLDQAARHRHRIRYWPFDLRIGGERAIDDPSALRQAASV